MKKLADMALLPFYCQNTLVALLLINFKLAWSYIFKMKITCINKRFYNFQIKVKLCNAACYVPSFIQTSKIDYFARNYVGIVDGTFPETYL
jgi:membrane-associated phospholipid phosphatase